MGYLLVGASLFAFVHPSKVYPDLIFLRLFFALGGSSCVAMVTAILPQMSPYSDATAKPAKGKLAGLAGLGTGIGALIAVVVFLPLPRVFIAHGYRMKEAVQAAFYVVGGVAFLISGLMFLGLKKDLSKGVGRLFRKNNVEGERVGEGYFKLMGKGFSAARDPRIALAYVGGLVARADSIVVSLFIPTVVSHYFVQRGLCTVDPHAPVEEIKEVARPYSMLIVGMSTSVFSCSCVDGLVTIGGSTRSAVGGMVLRSIRPEVYPSTHRTYRRPRVRWIRIS